MRGKAKGKKTVKLIVGNWKMNGQVADGRALAKTLALFAEKEDSDKFKMVLCPPTTLMSTVALLCAESPVDWGGQDCHAQPAGAYTGDIAAPMLKDLGCSYVIVGHSERRQYHRETSTEIAAKAKVAHAAGLIAIICVGELDAERAAGKAETVVSAQLKESIPDTATPANTVIAYEPVWAIGTGKTASADDIRQMHAYIRRAVGEGYALLYGGSVKAANAADILHTPNVDGVLVGGASLKADEFQAIARAS